MNTKTLTLMTHSVIEISLRRLYPLTIRRLS